MVGTIKCFRNHLPLTGTIIKYLIEEYIIVFCYLMFAYEIFVSIVYYCKSSRNVSTHGKIKQTVRPIENRRYTSLSTENHNVFNAGLCGRHVRHLYQQILLCELCVQYYYYYYYIMYKYYRVVFFFLPKYNISHWAIISLYRSGHSETLKT